MSFTGTISPSWTRVNASSQALARPLGRRRVERVRAEDDHLRVASMSFSRGSRSVARVAGRDHVATGHRHHLGEERVVGRGEDLRRLVSS
jgi:hypothetical protein